MDSTKTVVTKETKNKISVDYEGKLSAKERFKKKIAASNTWIKGAVGVLKFILMLGISYVILFPFFSKIAGSFMSKADVVDATVSLIPKEPTLEIYKWLIIDNRYFSAFLNTLILALACALIQTFVSCLVGYGLSKFKFKGNGVVMILVVVMMIIPHSTLDVAMLRHFTNFDLADLTSISRNGILTSIFGQIDLVDTFWPFIILSVTGLAFKNGLYIYMMRQFFKGVPDELEESAYVDGSGTFRTFLQIIIPLSVPMMITIFLFSFSWQWTDSFYTTLFFTSKVPLMPSIIKIPTSLKAAADYAAATLYNNAINNTCGLLIILPLVILYLFCQRYLVEGIERSGLVG